MKIGILVLAAGRKAGGVETYEVELIRALAAIDHVNRYTIYCPDEDARAAIGVHQENVICEVLRPSSRVISISLSLPILLRTQKIDVFHATYAPPPFPPERMVFTCHGLSNFLYPGSFSTITRWRLNSLHRLAIRRAARIICVSNHTSEQLQKQMKISPARLAVALHGVGKDFCIAPREAAREAVAKDFDLKRPYVLYVGKVQQLKNTARLIAAFKAFRERCCPHLQLVMAGKILQEPSILRNCRPEDGVVMLGHVAPALIPDLYRAAEMLVFPSLFESFGMPVLEAMRSGTPVICSNAGAMPEVCGDAAYLVDPESTEAIAFAMEEVYRDADLRDSLIRRGLEQAQRYSWQQTAERTLQVYKEVFAGHPAKKVCSEETVEQAYL
jgi:glycosyltransferase involved in cell wall biosynthesis